MTLTLIIPPLSVLLYSKEVEIFLKSKFTFTSWSNHVHTLIRRCSTTEEPEDGNRTQGLSSVPPLTPANTAAALPTFPRYESQSCQEGGLNSPASVLPTLRDGFRSERGGGMRSVSVHQPVRGRQNPHAAAGRAAEPRLLPGLLPQRVPRFLHHRESGRTGSLAEGTGTGLSLPVFHERGSAGLVRDHRVVRVHPHQWPGQRGEEHRSWVGGWCGGSRDGQPHIFG